MRKVTVLLLASTAASLLTAAPASPFSLSHHPAPAAGPDELRFDLFGWRGGVYYSASLFGTPSDGILFPGTPRTVDLTGLLNVELEVVGIDELGFTLDTRVELKGVVLHDGVAHHSHGLYRVCYSPTGPTPIQWDHDLNVTGYNGPGLVHLWAIRPTSGTWAFEHAVASRAQGTTDLSFGIQEWISADLSVSTFGVKTNTIDYAVELTGSVYQGSQALPFGFFTLSTLADPGLVFEVAGQGCAMAHCDPQMSDNSHLPVPTSEKSEILWHDPAPAGTRNGVGCTANGTVAACTYCSSTGDSLVVYDPRGERLWTSGDHLGYYAWASAPMFDEQGGVIAADDAHLIRFRPDGTIFWKTPIPDGVPTSPVITASGVIVVATWNGPVVAFDNITGRLLGLLYLTDDSGDRAFYETVNTPCVKGDRVYISTEKRNDPDHTGRLWAVDVDPADPEGTIRARWSFPFGGPSGASPLFMEDTVYFDGDRPAPGGAIAPHVWAVQDTGDTGELRWRYPMETPVRASLSRDPRGGLWAFAIRRQWLHRLDGKTGERIERLDIDRLLDEPGLFLLSSVMSIHEDGGNPVMTLGLVTYRPGDPAWVMAVDLETRERLWKVKISDDWEEECEISQFPALQGEGGKPILIFGGNTSGAYGVGVP